MKQIIFISLLALTLSAQAQLEDDPSTFCAKNGSHCTEKMRSITDQYNAGNSDFTKEDLIGFSGSCYHISETYDKNHEHHGAFLFARDKNNQTLATTGIFSFFAEQDPYKEMNSVELRDYFVKTNSRFSKAIEKPNQVELQYLSERADLHYWFRTNPQTGKFLLIASQAIETYLGFIFCEMTAR
jgi:hypothetical protein